MNEKGRNTMLYISSEKVSCNDVRIFFNSTLHDDIVVNLGRKYKSRYSCGLLYKDPLEKLAITSKITEEYKKDIKFM